MTGPMSTFWAGRPSISRTVEGHRVDALGSVRSHVGVGDDPLHAGEGHGENALVGADENDFVEVRSHVPHLRRGSGLGSAAIELDVEVEGQHELMRLDELAVRRPLVDPRKVVVVHPAFASKHPETSLEEDRRCQSAGLRLTVTAERRIDRGQLRRVEGALEVELPRIIARLGIEWGLRAGPPQPVRRQAHRVWQEWETRTIVHAWGTSGISFGGALTRGKGRLPTQEEQASPCGCQIMSRGQTLGKESAVRPASSIHIPQGGHGSGRTRRSSSAAHRSANGELVTEKRRLLFRYPPARTSVCGPPRAPLPSPPDVSPSPPPVAKARFHSQRKWGG